MLKGSCLCGGVRYEVEGELTQIGLCHCSMCRKASGTAFAANAPVPNAAFRLIAGFDLLRSYASSPGKQRFFCHRCGSPIYSKSEKYPELIRIRIGALDTPAGRTPDYHFMIGSKADWYEPPQDGRPRHGDVEPGRH